MPVAAVQPRERMVLRAAREIKEGETVFVGTRLPLLAYLVAKGTHAPNAVAFYENGLVREKAHLLTSWLPGAGGVHGCEVY